MRHFFLLAFCLILTSCDHDHKSPPQKNSHQNVSSRDNHTLGFTLGDQSENQIDRLIVQRIQRTLLSDHTLSPWAKNITVISKNGIVTLQGHVANEREGLAIVNMVKQVQGISRVYDQLEIARRH